MDYFSVPPSGSWVQAEPEITQSMLEEMKAGSGRGMRAKEEKEEDKEVVLTMSKDREGPSERKSCEIHLRAVTAISGL